MKYKVSSTNVLKGCLKGFKRLKDINEKPFPFTGWIDNGILDKMY